VRLNALISDLLDLSRLTGKVEMEMGTFNIEDLIRRSMDNFALKSKEKNIKISLKIDKPLLSVHADSRWIGQVIDNLLMNALKFSGNGSHVTITGHNKGDVVVIGVIDNGPGIPLDEQKLVFEKFYRGRNHLSRTMGTGLGLAISKSVIEKHGGKIWVESKLGEGSQFFFALPVAKKN
jgi:signal transduction histidine kinase